MPYYQCPKCSGRDTYEGTELVSGSSGGGAIIGPENDLGFSPVVGVGGKSTVNEQTVVKCKTCDIILGQKDRFLTNQEIEKIRTDEKEAKELEEASTFGNIWLILFIVLIISFIDVLFFNHKIKKETTWLKIISLKQTYVKKSVVPVM